MPFQQKKLTKSINQSRGIFDKFIYQPDNGDGIATIIAAGYFAESRFLSDPDWINSVIEIKADDGYVIGRINDAGDVEVYFNSITAGGGSNIVRVSTDYEIQVSDDYVISDGSNTLTLPLFAEAVKAVFLVNEGVTNDTVDGNGSTVPGGTSLTPTQSRGFIPGTSEWLEV